MNVLLINLARMGDLVQITPAARGLKAEYGCRITMLVTQPLAAFARTLDGIDEIISIDDALLQCLVHKKNSIVQAFTVWQKWLFELKQLHFDMTINVTHNEFSSCLANYLGAPRILGRTQDMFGGAHISGVWFRYYFAIADKRPANCFNTADIYRRGCEVIANHGPVTINIDSSSQNTIAYHINDLPRPIIALHPGANHPNKRWSMDSFRSLASMLTNEGYGVVVLGSKEEEALAQNVVSACGPHGRSLAGQIPLHELPVLLSAMNLMVANDTGPLHIAAATGIPTISIFLAMARPENTAPYREGNYVFETTVADHPCLDETATCSNPRCAESIPPEAVIEVIRALVHNKKPELQQITSTNGEFRLLRTFFNADGYCSLETIAHTGHAVSRRMLRSYDNYFLWRTVLDNAQMDQEAKEALRARIEPVDQKRLQKAINLLDAINARMCGEPLAMHEGKKTTLAHLEEQWLDLEVGIEEVVILLQLCRLEREALYPQGLEKVLRELPGIIARWRGTIKHLINDK